MILLYFVITLTLALGILFLKNAFWAKFLILLHVILQLSFNAYALLNRNNTDFYYFTYDATALLLLSVFTLISTASVYHGFKYFGKRITKHFFSYHAALILLISFISAAYMANDATVIWILIEATTLAASFLIYHEKTNNGLEAAWKYMFLCSVGIAFAYIGILFIGMSAEGGIRDGLSFHNIAAIASKANPIYLKIAFVFTLIGFSTKMELFPMHTAGIDANSVAPTPAAAILSTGIVNLGFVAVFRIYTAFAHTSILSWMNNILIITGILSVIVASGYMLKARHSKRLLAYSTLENMGLVALALGIGGKAVYAAFMLLLVHALVKAALFFQLGQLSRTLNTWKIEESGHYFKKNPAGAFIMFAGMFALLAIPPSGSFMAEYFIFFRLAETNNWLLFILTALILCALIYAFSVRLMHMLCSSPLTGVNNNGYRTVNPLETWSQFIFLILAFIPCFYQPPIVHDLINSAISLLP